jgi:hypothetical protein
VGRMTALFKRVGFDHYGVSSHGAPPLMRGQTCEHSLSFSVLNFVQGSLLLSVYFHGNI